jgi:hypothetical protein
MSKAIMNVLGLLKARVKRTEITTSPGNNNNYRRVAAQIKNKMVVREPTVISSTLKQRRSLTQPAKKSLNTTRAGAD